MSETHPRETATVVLAERAEISRPAWVLPTCFLLGSILWTLSLPRTSASDDYSSRLSILAILAFVPIFYGLPGSSPRRAAAWGWAGGFLWEAGTLWWLVPTLTRYGEMGTATAIALIAGMCAVLGLYMSLFVGLLAFLLRRRGLWAFAAAPFLWVLVEWLRGHLLTGMPWWGPGYSLSMYPILLQCASLFGILGLSFMAVLVSAALSLGLMDRRSAPAMWTALSAILLFAAACSYGISHGDWRRPRSGCIPIGYVQPQIPQDEKWDSAYTLAAEEKLFRLSNPFRLYHLKLLVWPESCFPGVWDVDDGFRRRVSAVAAELGSPILLGAMIQSKEGGVCNGAVLVLPDGTEGGRYAKTHLVPFGEYVPFRRFLAFARPLVEVIGDIQAGSSLEPLPSPAGRLGVSICFEGLFSGLVREQVDRGAEILVNITNDAWYEGTPGPIQHFFIQRVRAVETGRYLIRSANGGISGVVNPNGRLEAATPKGQAASFWGEVVPLKTKTLYQRIGDNALWGALLISLFFLFFPAKARF